MGFVKPPTFSRNHDVEVELAGALLRVDQLLLRPPAGAASAAPAAAQYLPGKWVAVAPNVASGIITRSAAQRTGQTRSVNL